MTKSVEQAYHEGFMAKMAEGEARLAPDTVLAPSLDDPYQLGIHGGRTGENYAPLATVSGLPRAGMTGLAEGGVLGTVLGHPVSQWLTAEGRKASKGQWGDDLKQLEMLQREIGNRAAVHGVKAFPMQLWQGIKSMATGAPTGSEQLRDLWTGVKNVANDVRQTPVAQAARPIIRRHLKGGLRAGLGLSAAMMALKAVKNRAEYATGKALTPKGPPPLKGPVNN